jgi:hypothetical protein
MTNPILLKTYRNVRDVAGEIHEAAGSVDDHLGRFQIYGTKEEIVHALREAELMFAKVERLEAEVRRCRSPAGNRRHGREVTPRPEAFAEL